MNRKRHIPVRIILLLLALTGAALYLFLGSVSVAVGKDRVTVGGTLAEEITLHYSDIDEYELRGYVDTGYRSFGLVTRKTMIGKYSSPLFGAYDLFLYRNVNKFILLRSGESLIIFNCPTEEETVSCFEKINAGMKSSADQSAAVPTPAAPESTSLPTESPAPAVAAETP